MGFLQSSCSRAHSLMSPWQETIQSRWNRKAKSRYYRSTWLESRLSRFPPPRGLERQRFGVIWFSPTPLYQPTQESDHRPSCPLTLFVLSSKAVEGATAGKSGIGAPNAVPDGAGVAPQRASQMHLSPALNGAHDLVRAPGGETPKAGAQAISGRAQGDTVGSDGVADRDRT